MAAEALHRDPMKHQATRMNSPVPQSYFKQNAIGALYPDLTRIQ
jgi:hypothetical protein